MSAAKDRKQAMEVTIEQQERSLRGLMNELTECRAGPTQDDIAHWITEVFVESDEWDACEHEGDVTSPTLGGLFRPDTIGRILVKHLQPIGTFNGGGSICVFRDPEAWEWPDLLKSKHRQLAERAGILSTDVREGSDE